MDRDCSLPEVLSEELADKDIDLGVFEAAVAAARDGVEGRLDTGLLESVQEDLALIVRYERVLVAMDDQEGRIVLCRARDGIG